MILRKQHIKEEKVKKNGNDIIFRKQPINKDCRNDKKIPNPKLHLTEQVNTVLGLIQSRK